jgi:glycosyltransferase involved in cell wall biosynthesis
VKYISMLTPGGRCKSGNKGLSLVSGEYINFLDDDDLFFADHIEVLVSELESNKKYRAAYTIGLEVKTHVISHNPLIYRESEYRDIYRQTFSRDELMKANYIPINCMLFSRDLYLKEGGFDEQLDVLEDWDLWIRYSQYTDFLFIERATCIYRVPESENISQERQQRMDKSYEVVRKKYNLE